MTIDWISTAISNARGFDHDIPIGAARAEVASRATAKHFMIA